MQKISSIHKLQQILGSHELKGQAFLKIIEATFSFPELTTPIFGHSHQKNYRSEFNFFELVSTCKKSGYFIDLLWRFCSFKNTPICLPESILAHISGTRFLPNIDYVQKHRQ